MKIRIHTFISGLVQGIFFRAATRTLAIQLNLTGWVRNLRDGRVEVVAEGEKENIDKLIQFLRKGPPGARVEKIEIKTEDYKDEFKDFKVVF